MLALPVGLVVSLWPVFRQGADGNRRLYAANVVLAPVILAVVALTWSGLLAHAYECEVFRVPYCD